jgi:hypothetical protein
MLAGVPGVKPDRMICRFVEDSLELRRRSVGTEFAYGIVTAAAKEMDMSATALDHATGDSSGDDGEGGLLGGLPSVPLVTLLVMCATSAGGLRTPL